MKPGEAEGGIAGGPQVVASGFGGAQGGLTAEATGSCSEWEKGQLLSWREPRGSPVLQTQTRTLREAQSLPEGTQLASVEQGLN